MPTMFDSLPKALKQQIVDTIAQYPKTGPTFEALYAHFDGPSRKKPKKEPVKKPTDLTDLKEKQDVSRTQPIAIATPIAPDQTIFQLLALLFMLPQRKKLNLVLHLLVQPGGQPTPVLSAANPLTMIPEVLIADFALLVKMCLLLPVLGSNLNAHGRKLGLLCLWMHEQYAINEKNEPVVVQLNFDVVKKEMIKTGKIPENIEDVAHDGDADVQPVHEAIIDFLERQFGLCGLNLINYLPSSAFSSKNKVLLDKDGGISISTDGLHSDLVMANAYRGLKEGILVLIAPNDVSKTPFLVYGFKKPILLYNMKHIKHISYTSITRITFNILITFLVPGQEEETIEFGMIDQQHFQAIDDFVKAQHISDNSFDDELREKRGKEEKDNDKGEGEDGDAIAEDEDEEEDGTYQAGMEEDSASGSGSDSSSDDDSDMMSEDDDDDDEEEDEENEAKGEEGEAKE